MEPDHPRAAHLLEESIGFLLARLASLNGSSFCEAISPLGLNPLQYGLLQAIDAGGPESQQTLGESLGISGPRMVALVDDLEVEGLVERRRGAPDRRVNLVHLTRKGRTTLTRAADAGSLAHDKFVRNLSPDERDQLLRLLQRLAEPHHLTLGGE